MIYVNYRDNMPVLRSLCANLSEILGKTVFPSYTTPGFAQIFMQEPGQRIRHRLAEGRVAQLCAIIEWEIAKAEGRLRDAA
jgi:hypothetical protein